jgi:hypothetical protein
MNTGRNMLRVVGLLCVILSAIASPLIAQNKPHSIRNVVLVHGAWADGSGWKGVYDILTKDGYNVSIVQEPETTFEPITLASGTCTVNGQLVPCYGIQYFQNGGDGQQYDPGQ